MYVSIKYEYKILLPDKASLQGLFRWFTSIFSMELAGPVTLFIECMAVANSFHSNANMSSDL